IRGALSKSDCGGIVVSFQCLVGGASLTSYFNACTPTEVVASLPSCRFTVCLFTGRGTAAYVERLALPHPSVWEPQTYDKAKASEPKPTFHRVTTLKKLGGLNGLPHRMSCGHSQMLWRELGLPFLDLATRVIRRTLQTFKRLSESKGCCSGGVCTA